MPRSSNYSRSRSPLKHKKHVHRSHSSSRSHRYKASPKRDYDSFRLGSNVESDIKNHIRFENVKIKKKVNEEQIIEDIRKKLSLNVGPVVHVTKIAEDNHAITIAVGFKFDSDALSYYHRKKGVIQTIDKDSTAFVPVATQVFEKMIPFIIQSEKEKERLIMLYEKKRLEQREREAREAHERDERERNKRRNRRSSSYRQRKGKYDSSESNHKSKHRRREFSSSSSAQNLKKHKNNHRNSSSESSRGKGKNRDSHPEKYKKLMVFGLPSHFKGKELSSYLTHHQGGPIYLSNLRWRQLQNSNCEYLQIELEEKKAMKLMAMRQELQIEGYKFVVMSSVYQDEDKIKSSLREYQVKITFPVEVHPFHVLKALWDVVGIVQVVTIGRVLENGACNGYIFTLNSSQKALQLKKLGRLASGIQVEEPSGMLVYRPTRQTKLLWPGKE